MSKSRRDRVTSLVQDMPQIMLDAVHSNLKHPFTDISLEEAIRGIMSMTDNANDIEQPEQPVDQPVEPDMLNHGTETPGTKPKPKLKLKQNIKRGE